MFYDNFMFNVTRTRLAKIPWVDKALLYHWPPEPDTDVLNKMFNNGVPEQGEVNGDLFGSFMRMLVDEEPPTKEEDKLTEEDLENMKILGVDEKAYREIADKIDYANEHPETLKPHELIEDDEESEE